MNNHNTLYERYHRQIILKEFGLAGQQKLLNAKVLVIGAGGLGCSALQYLAGAGVGTLGIADDDIVSISNLHRQVIYKTGDVGLKKALAAGKFLQELNPELELKIFIERLTNINALQILNEYDVILDGTDNFATRYLINDACILLGKPLVYGAISQYEGQVAVFNCNNNQIEIPVNYRDLFPLPPKNNEILNCAEAGVIGVLPGIIGTMMANETIKLITGIGVTLSNKILTYNTLTNHSSIFNISPVNDTGRLTPKDKSAFLRMDYDWLCAPETNGNEIEFEYFLEKIKREKIDVIDVREPEELPVVKGFNYKNIPLGLLNDHLELIKSETVVLFCKTGKRSQQAAAFLLEKFGSRMKIYSIQGGINGWEKQQISKEQ